MSKMTKFAAALLGLSALALASPASAFPINTPLPTNTYISFGGLDWAWASPCSPTGCTDNTDILDLSYQSTQGWRLPTLAELTAGPAPSDFSVIGANVPFDGTSVEGTFFTDIQSDGACAAAYFTNGFYNECNYSDAVGGYIYGLGTVNAANPNAETWVVRGEVPVPTPEPITLSLFGAGLAGAVAMRRRKKASSRV